MVVIFFSQIPRLSFASSSSAFTTAVSPVERLMCPSFRSSAIPVFIRAQVLSSARPSRIGSWARQINNGCPPPPPPWALTGGLYGLWRRAYAPKAAKPNRANRTTIKSKTSKTRFIISGSSLSRSRIGFAHPSLPGRAFARFGQHRSRAWIWVNRGRVNRSHPPPQW